MGRRSLREERQNQILDAFELALVELGYAGATLERIAARADVHRTIIRHYFGGRDELVAALLERLRSRYSERYRYDDVEGTPRERLERLLDTMFLSQTQGPPSMDRVFDALYAAGSTDPAVSSFLIEFYRDASRRLSALIREAHPSAPTDSVREVATGVLGLAVGHSILDTIEPVRERAKRLRRVAAGLLDRLG